MISSSTFSQGVQGMQQSQRKMLQAAEDIVRAGVSPREQQQGQTGSVPVTDAGSSTNDLGQVQTVPENQEVDRAQLRQSNPEDIVAPLIEQKRQQQLFNASAEIVKADNENVGTLIDDLS